MGLHTFIGQYQNLRRYDFRILMWGNGHAQTEEALCGIPFLSGCDATLHARVHERK